MCCNQITVFCHVTSLDTLLADLLPLRSYRFLHVTLPPFTLLSLLSFLWSSLPLLLPSSLRGKTELDKIVMMKLLPVVCGISTDKHSINGSPIILMTELQFHSPVCYCVQVIQYWVWGGGVIGCQRVLSCCLPAPAYSLWCTPSGGICPHCTNIYYYWVSNTIELWITQQGKQRLSKRKWCAKRRYVWDTPTNCLSEVSHPTLFLRLVGSLCFPVIPAQLLRPGGGWNASCTDSGGFA